MRCPFDGQHEEAELMLTRLKAHLKMCLFHALTVPAGYVDGQEICPSFYKPQVIIVPLDVIASIGPQIGCDSTFASAI